MKREQALRVLAQAKPVLMDRLGVTRLAVFGSTARNAAGAESDVDVLVAFDGAATASRYFGAQFFLEDELGCVVDLVSEKALRPEIRRAVEQELVDV